MRKPKREESNRKWRGIFLRLAVSSSARKWRSRLLHCVREKRKARRRLFVDDMCREEVEEATGLCCAVPAKEELNFFFQTSTNFESKIGRGGDAM